MIQAFIPVGFMPAFADDTKTIIICSGITGETVEIQIDNDPSNKHDEGQSSQCSFSVVGAYHNATVPKIAKLDVSYIASSSLIHETFTLQSVFLSNHTRGPPSISLI